MKQTYSLEKIDAIAKKLQSLPPIEKKQPDLTKSESIKKLSKEITELQKRGYTLEQIAESLSGEGLTITTPTLKSYLQREKQGKTKKTKEPSKTTAIEQTQAKKSKASFTPRPDSDEI